ncbi:MAG: hypothetical protein HYU66_03960 [Armatimonadetes bacterium]|nr:hypothetical protein [Armatimonadota bacterium]
MKTVGFLLTFCAMQVIAQLLFKYGSAEGAERQRWLLGFIGGNLFGASSIWLMMLLYRQIKSGNVAMGLASGLSFLLIQVALAIVFKTRLSPLQMAGAGTICAGIVMMCLGGKSA